MCESVDVTFNVANKSTQQEAGWPESRERIRSSSLKAQSQTRGQKAEEEYQRRGNKDSEHNTPQTGTHSVRPRCQQRSLFQSPAHVESSFAIIRRWLALFLTCMSGCARRARQNVSVGNMWSRAVVSLPQINETRQILLVRPDSLLERCYCQITRTAMFVKCAFADRARCKYNHAEKPVASVDRTGRCIRNLLKHAKQ